eukprot:CAMPEP_0201707558 /NCGR_PEP_ID=MMETSP0578-20130828/52297_1 /ASSEMBLY_ACC=CAM_ASM_000663 /TAXON_ID=267565 /ORGANISM="Skeletonema grethea, Strain CCMP 1804" /LENGTH=188 /DNA_ID=CAMNT_0048196203 /DNA_START=113 /DNA_END=676 /DNA_ORIENTATION=+
MGVSGALCSVDEWIQEALYEYEQIANLCNEQSHLGNVSLVVPPPPSRSSSDSDPSFQPLEFDPKTLENVMKHNQLVDHLSTYSQAIDSVRNTHVRLKSKLLSLSIREDKEVTTTSLPNNSTNNKSEQNIQIPRRTTSAMQDAFTNHIELSERVTGTIMKSSKTDCGVLFGNGMIRTSSPNDHEMNVVA